MIVRTKKGWKVVSSTGKNLSADNLTRQEAEDRLRQVEYFKHRKPVQGRRARITN